MTFGPPLSCLDFKLVFRNTSLPFNRVTSNEYEILFDNTNYTDIVITGTSISLNSCTAALGHSNISATAFTQFNNRELFDDMRSHLFNSTPITITRARIQRSFIAATVQELTAFVYLQNTWTKNMIGYQYRKIILKMSEQTLYAKTAASFIQVEADKVLYLDGGSSYDLKTGTTPLKINYLWSIEGFPGIFFPNSKILTLAPDQRA